MRTVFITDKNKESKLTLLQQSINTWIKELNFIQYEQEALQNIINMYCENFCGFENLKKTRKLDFQLTEQIKKSNLLLLEIHTFNKKISTVLERIYLKEDFIFESYTEIEKNYKEYIKGSKSLKKRIYLHAKRTMFKSTLKYLLPIPPKPYIPI